MRQGHLADALAATAIATLAAGCTADGAAEETAAMAAFHEGLAAHLAAPRSSIVEERAGRTAALFGASEAAPCATRFARAGEGGDLLVDWAAIEEIGSNNSDGRVYLTSEGGEEIVLRLDPAARAGPLAEIFMVAQQLCAGEGA